MQEKKRIISGQLKCLGMDGDITIEWEQEDHDKMVKIIQEKLDKGMLFFIIKKKFHGIPFTGGLKKLKNAKKINDQKVIIKDKDVAKYFNGVTTATIVDDSASSGETLEVVKRSTDAEEIAKSTATVTKTPTAG